MLRKTTGRSALLLLLLSLAAGACRRGEEPAAVPAAQQAEGPRRGGTVVSSWTAEPSGVNELIQPSSQVNSEMLFRVLLHLVEEQADFEDHPPTFAPQLARSYGWSEDHKTLTFHLRDDVVWSDGVPVTAEDVRWTWQAQVHPDIAWDSAEAKQAIRDVEVVDPQTVRFHFTRVYAKQLLDANEGMILPRHVWSKLPFSEWRQNADWFRQHMVFNGPFTIASWEPQQQIVLQRNERYHEKGLPYLDRVVMRIVPDQASGLTQALAGDIDFASQIPPGDVPRVKASPHLDLISYWSNLYVVVGWNNEHPLFSDAEVRRALTLAIDRRTIVDTLLGEYGRVGKSPIVSMVWAHDKSFEPWPYDPAEARRILAAKGWKDGDGDGILDRGGKPFAFELLSNAGNQVRADATVMIQDQLKKVGIRAEPRQIEFNTLIDRTIEGDYDASVIGFTMDTSLDLTSNLDSRAVDRNNYMRYGNPEVDRLLEIAARQPEIAQAKPYLDQIQRIVHRDQPVTFLWESQRLTAVNKKVRDARPNYVQSLFNLKEWWVKPAA